MLCQLSYAPQRFERSSLAPAPDAQSPGRLAAVRSPSQRGALGLLFLLLGFGFAGVAYAAALGREWVIVGAAVVLALWLEGLAVRAFRAR